MGDRSISPCRAASYPTGDIDGAYNGEANFGFNFTCEMTAKNKAVIKGEITYHDTGTSTLTESTSQKFRLHGVVDPMHHSPPPNCEAAAQIFMDAAQFDGTYRSQDTSLTSAACPAGSTFWCSTRVSRAARKTQHSSPATGSPSS